VAMVAAGGFSGRSSWLLRRLAPDVLLLPGSQEAEAARRAGLNAARLPGGVDLQRFRPVSAGEKAMLRRRWSMPRDRQVVLHVGRLRHGETMRGILGLARAGATVVFVTSRHDAESEPLRQRLFAAGVVVRDGYHAQMEQLYNLSDCYVFAAEGRESGPDVPLSVLEALASDLPVLGLRLGPAGDALATFPGVTLVQDASTLVARALAAMETPTHARSGVEARGWAPAVEQVLDAIDDAVVLRSTPRPRGGWRKAAVAQIRRSAVARRDWPRAWLTAGRVGYETRRPGGPAVAAPAGALVLPAWRSPARAVIGTLGSRQGSLPAVAGLLGVGVEAAGEHDDRDPVERAREERWPLLHAPASDLDLLPASRRDLLVRYVREGGTLALDGLRPDHQHGLAKLCRGVGLDPPAATETSAPVTALTFPADRPDVARELAGASVEAACGRAALRAHQGWELLALGERRREQLGVMVRRRAGMGAIVLSTAPAALEGELSGAFGAGSADAAAALLSLLLLRATYGEAAWHPPAALANFTIDDPALRRGRLGLRWDLLLGQARAHRYHVTIATVPRELSLADPAVVEAMRRHPDLLSACYHGCDHDGYEFYPPDAGRTRYRPRRLPSQRAALERAVRHGADFRAAHGLELDRVMVFPYGPGPAAIFGDLHRLGFLATSNFEDKYPPGSARPEDPYLGLRPADLAWAGFPLLWRRSTDDRGYLLDLALGRPALTFGHPGDLGRDFAPFAERAEVLNRATVGAVAWCGLDEIARHAYLQRRRPDGSWEVLMTSSEACLHNPGPEPRWVFVRRPRAPADAALEVGGRRREAEDRPVVVPPQRTLVVRLRLAGPAPALPGPRACSIRP
jgi:hypothetical protein